MNIQQLQKVKTQILNAFTIQFMRDMVDAGHCVAVCHDAQSAIELIEQYVNLPAMGRIKVNELEEKNVYWDEDFICHIASCSAY